MKDSGSVRAGWLYLVIIELFIVFDIIGVMAGLGDKINFFLNVVLTDSMLMIPVIVYVVINKGHIGETFSFRHVKLSTLLLSIVFTILWYPLIICCNAFSMIFTENAVMSMSDEFINYPFILTWLIVACFGPLFEELTFRGAVFSGLKSSGRTVAAIILQGLLFGLLHLNLNQMMYATVIGIEFGLLVHVTGSIWCSFVSHMFINTIGVSGVYMLSSMSDQLQTDMMQDQLQGEGFTGMLLGMAFVMLAVGVVSLLLAMLLLKAIAANEGRSDVFAGLFAKREKGTAGEQIFSLPLLLGIILSVIFIIIRLFIE